MSISLTAALKLDEAAEVTKIAERMRELLRSHLHRRGLVVAISGGVDSSVCAALAVLIYVPTFSKGPLNLRQGQPFYEPFP